MPVHPKETILSMQTGVAYCNVPSKFSGTHGLHVYLFSICSSSSMQDSFPDKMIRHSVFSDCTCTKLPVMGFDSKGCKRMSLVATNILGTLT